MLLLGLMSGTSLDGVDIAYCDINDDGYTLLAAATYSYSPEWSLHLANLQKASAYQYALADVEYGHLLGRIVNNFRQEHPGHVDAIASHGHTIFHQPNQGITTQIGDGNAIAAETGLPVVYNFRALDVALGGQGAPLVPIGDELLFGQYDACLNLGGICNISFQQNDRRVAFDICPCNMALNRLAGLVGKPYDNGGTIARSGIIIRDLLNRMDSLDYYRQPLPKSLGKEWFDSRFLPLLETNGSNTADLLCTTVEHIARQIAWAVKGRGINSILATGGGAKNRFLIARLQSLIPGCHITVPPDDIIDYKEAIIFALLGYLRLNLRPNCLSSVTGAKCDNIGGDIAGLIP